MIRKLSALFTLMLLAMPFAAHAYTIVPGDMLQVEVLEDATRNRSVLVLPDGSINFPGAGMLRVAGMTPETARERIAAKLAPEFASPPSVYVSVAALAAPGEALADTNVIYVMGEINKPGILATETGITLLQAIAQAGGFTRFAATKRVELHRMDPASQTEQVYVFDYKTGKGISGATRLTEGDVVVVPERRLFE